MMKDMLECYFGIHYGSSRKVEVICRKMKGRFSLVDPKACFDCDTFSPALKGECDKSVMNCSSGEDVIDVIDFEAFVDNYQNLKAIHSGRRCDYLLVGSDKIVFCDLTCSKSKYIDPFLSAEGVRKEGKRFTARRQVENSVKLLMDVPEIGSEISTKANKICLFAYRVKDVIAGDTFDARIIGGMKSFGAVEEKVMEEPMYSDMNDGFLFTEIRYPETYVW